MKHITILVPKGAILGSIEGPRQLLTGVNAYYASMGKPPIFKVELVGLTNETPLSNGLYTIRTDNTIGTLAKTDLIIIPAIDGDINVALRNNHDFIPWLIDRYKEGAELASLCLGAFLLASTGLIDGHKCATHWVASNNFRKMFPNVDLVTEKIVTDEHGIYTSGGAYSYLTLVLYLIEKYCGRAAAIFCAKIFAIDIDRESQ
ncbi:MAG TPA: DJ-1/PfpI family protein, partial [Chryseosolibacter sp.]|nr:DJ-1/PfpI family protein [Chryseosolibacter sp.]